MTTLTAQAVIAADGTLRLELPTDLPPGPADVVVVVQPTPPASDRSGPSLAGKLAGTMPVNLDVVAEIRALRQRTTQEAQELPE